jgi:multicomponent Na+:H+ antiporter subunit D
MLLTIPIILPTVLGLLLAAIRFPTRKGRDVFTCLSALISAVAMWAVILTDRGGSITLIKMSETVAITLTLAGMGKIFAGLAATLWPITSFYAVEYMRPDRETRAFSSFFIMSMGATLGIALSGTMLSMYFFYELLTLSTLPLVLHGMTEKTKKAGVIYLCYSIGGAAFAFIAVAFSIFYGGGGFVMGGSLTAGAFRNENLAMVIYVLSFMGFGVKAAVFPLHDWLPKASVAPTPVTALLHAVAVVKAGAFAVIRLTYYVFGAEFLAGSWAQQVVMGVTVVTIIFGSTMALKERHLKRRLAYSTCANLSYILFGVTQMSDIGLTAGVTHLLFHSIIKIGAFFAAGAVLHNTHREFIDDLNGLGKKMPVTFVCFTVFGFSLMGLPPFNGFISKWYLAESAVGTASVMSTIGICALLYSALITAIYMMTVSVRAFFPRKAANTALNARVREVNGFMTAPLVLFAVLCLVTGLMGGTIFRGVASVLGV